MQYEEGRCSLKVPRLAKKFIFKGEWCGSEIALNLKVN